MIKTLIDLGADPNLADKSGTTRCSRPPRCATTFPRSRCCWRTAPEVDEPGPEGFIRSRSRSPNARYEVAKALIEGGADVSAASGAGRTDAADGGCGASRAGRRRALRARQRPADRHCQGDRRSRRRRSTPKPKNGMTALMVAAAHNNAPMIGLLMDAGADPTLKNAQGLTATDVAEKNGQSRGGPGHLGLGLGTFGSGARASRQRRRDDKRVTMRSLSRWLHVVRAAMLAAALGFIMLGPVSAGEIRRGRGQAGGRRRHRRTLQGRRLRLPRSQARRRPQSCLRAGQDRARHARLWLVRQYHLPRQGDAEEAIRHRFLVQARRRQAQADGHPRAEGPEAGGRRLDHGHAPAGRLVVAAGAGASRRHGGDPRLAGDERDPQLHRHQQGRERRPAGQG